jgi:DNA-directed RNA polymerase subunit RPC12/RpoP
MTMSSDTEFEGNTTLDKWLDENQCPRCGHYIPNDLHPGAYPGALSRYDNATYVCSDCGTEEAMIQWHGNDKRLELDHSDWYALLIESIVVASTPEEGRAVVAKMLNITSDA